LKQQQQRAMPSSASISNARAAASQVLRSAVFVPLGSIASKLRQAAAFAKSSALRSGVMVAMIQNSGMIDTSKPLALRIM
jgi:hypothetical protein